MGLIVAGISAFILSVIVAPMLPPDIEFEITVFNILFQSLGYFVMIAIANMFYFLGPISESLISPRNPNRFRRAYFQLGFWFSVLLPFSFPASLITHSLAHSNSRVPSSTMINHESKLSRQGEFWKWFSENSNDIASDFTDADLVGEIDKWISHIWPDLSWEIGPLPNRDLYLALSPNLDHDHVPIAEDAVASAPRLPNWAFLPYRPVKEWDGNFSMQLSNGAQHNFDSSLWKFVLLKYEDGEYEILLQAPGIERLSDVDRWQAAAIALEGYLGKKVILRHSISFELMEQFEDTHLGTGKNMNELSALLQREFATESIPEAIE